VKSYKIGHSLLCLMVMLAPEFRLTVQTICLNALYKLRSSVTMMSPRVYAQVFSTWITACENFQNWPVERISQGQQLCVHWYPHDRCMWPTVEIPVPCCAVLASRFLQHEIISLYFQVKRNVSFVQEAV